MSEIRIEVVRTGVKLPRDAAEMRIARMGFLFTSNRNQE
jgi:hypothetical protein